MTENDLINKRNYLRSLISVLTVELDETEDALENKPDEAWQSLVKAGEIVPAIKLHRGIYGTSLKESKDAIDNYRGTL